MSKKRKAAVNLTLSPEAVRQGNKLKKPLVRGSLSSVVEYLIVSKHEELFALAVPVLADAGKKEVAA